MAGHSFKVFDKIKRSCSRIFKCGRRKQARNLPPPDLHGDATRFVANEASSLQAQNAFRPEDIGRDYHNAQQGPEPDVHQQQTLGAKQSSGNDEIVSPVADDSQNRNLATQDEPTVAGIHDAGSTAAQGPSDAPPVANNDVTSHSTHPDDGTGADAQSQEPEDTNTFKETLPEVKNVEPAPGMSATSGPLEDWPEGDATAD